jgi:hypothetical protein
MNCRLTSLMNIDIKSSTCCVWWFMAAIPATQETDRRITEASLGKKVNETLALNNKPRSWIWWVTPIIPDTNRYR